MFQSLDEQMKQSDAEAVPTSTAAIRYAVIALLTLAIFGGLYAVMMLAEY